MIIFLILTQFQFFIAKFWIRLFKFQMTGDASRAYDEGVDAA